MTYDELTLVADHYRVNDIKHRAKATAESYYRVQYILRHAKSQSSSWVWYEADKVRKWSRGVNLKRLHGVIARLTGETTCW